MLAALWALAWIARDGAMERVNWRDMGPEELGSVYESLLELVPQIGEGAQSFKFAAGDETRGNARKLSGSYYTPDGLVQELLDSALEPVIAQKKAEHPEDEAAAILSITVIDPAVGSGHFLLAAARRLAAHLARVRAQGQPGAPEHRRAMRDVVSHCLFGVDRNPMALELAKIALWLEAMTPEAPLSFLDTHLVLGDALLGVLDPVCLGQGIPDNAYKPLTGDNGQVCARLKKRNRDARKTLENLSGKGGQQMLGFATQTVAAALAELDAMPDDTLDALAAKRTAYETVREKQKQSGLAEDLLLAAYLMSKQAATEAHIPTSEHLMRALTGQPLDEAVVEAARRTARQHHVFHWRDAFAQVFAGGGFSCVLGNPPWEQIQLSEEEFFASRAPSIAVLAGAKRKVAIDHLAETSPLLLEEFQTTKRIYEATSVYAREATRFRLTAMGKLNTYPLFAETAFNIRALKGRTGIIVPSGIATDDSTKAFFAHMVEGRLVSLFDFENREALFPAVDSRMKFSLFTIGSAERAELAFFLTQPEQIRDVRRRFSLMPEDFAQLNPNTRTCPVFRSQADADLTKKIYARVPVLWDENQSVGNPWGIELRQGLFNMTSDSGLFRTADRRDELTQPVPLYEAKFTDQYDHRRGSYAERGVTRGFRVLPESTLEDYQNPAHSIEPFYWTETSLLSSRIPEKWTCSWFIGFKDVTAVTNERTVFSTVIPRAAVGHTFPLIFPESPKWTGALLLATLNSIVLDYCARQKVGGLHLTYGYLKQFPVPTPESFSSAHRLFIVSRALELTYTAYDLKPFYDDVVAENPAFDPRGGAERGQPFLWIPQRRAQLRAELDAYFARLYGLTRDELRYILDPSDAMGPDYPSETFRVLKDKETRQFGEYRTRRLVLEAWDALEFQRTVEVPVARTARRRGIRQRPYAPMGVPCCEAEDWLAGLVCDAVAYGGAMSEPTLRLVLSVDISVTGRYGAELLQWTTQERLDRLPLVMKWLRDLLGIPVTHDLSVSNQSDLSPVLGDHRTEYLARELVDVYRARQEELALDRLKTSADADGESHGTDVKRA